MSVRLGSFSAYEHWLRRLLRFHHLRHPREMGSVEVKAFLCHLAVALRADSATRAMSDFWGQIDPNSYSYRYPIDNKGDTSTEKHQELSLNELSVKMTLILDQLETIHFGLNLEIDRHQELCSDRISNTSFEDEF